MGKIEVKYEIDDGVPIPVKRNNLDVIRKMEVGQSVEFAIDKRQAVAQATFKERLKSGKEFTTRKLDEKTIRTWRLK